jgi:hypothetical protein
MAKTGTTRRLIRNLLGKPLSRGQGINISTTDIKNPLTKHEASQSANINAALLAPYSPHSKSLFLISRG